MSLPHSQVCLLKLHLHQNDKPESLSLLSIFFGLVTEFGLIERNTLNLLLEFSHGN